ncbi:MAG: hypothetical protein WCI66_02750 [Gammaproteobacteria bacterium]
MKMLFKRMSLLPVVLVLTVAPVLAMAGGHAGRGFHSIGHGPVRVIRPHYNLYPGIGLGIGMGIGYSAFGAPYYGHPYGYPYGGHYYPSREVIVEHNTYSEQPETSSVPIHRNETSLLRDLQGRCYQRTYDQHGNELRTELDPSDCNF